MANMITHKPPAGLSKMTASILRWIHAHGPMTRAEVEAVPELGTTAGIRLGDLVQNGFLTAAKTGTKNTYKTTTRAVRMLGCTEQTEATAMPKRLPYSDKPYNCPELRPFESRAGCNDAFLLPSLIGGQRVAPRFNQAV